MTVIATMIAHSGTAHATDSLLTTRDGAGNYVPVETQETKIVPVQHFRGALAYWGYAGRSGGTRTVDWLRQRATEAAQSPTPEEFAASLARKLQEWLVGQGVANDARFGVGVHYSAYEWIGHQWIPELFLISNFVGPDYASLRPTGVGYSRETCATVEGRPREPEDRLPERREAVQAYLRGGGWLRFNNGDPALFNPTADSVAAMLELAKSRGVLADIDVLRLQRWTRLPVAMVALLQRDFYRPGVQIVGGQIHDLAVSRTGVYSSTQGETP